MTTSIENKELAVRLACEIVKKMNVTVNFEKKAIEIYQECFEAIKKD